MKKEKVDTGSKKPAVVLNVQSLPTAQLPPTAQLAAGMSEQSLFVHSCGDWSIDYYMIAELKLAIYG